MTSGLMAFGQGLNTLSKQEKKDGFKLLFDGKTFGGWHTYGKPGKVGASWTIENGIIGFDYKIKNTPLNISVDWQPAFSIIQSYFKNNGGISVRYVLK